MRLTKLHREAFVRRVMQDVPQVDYAEELRKVVLNAFVQALPEPVRQVWNNPEHRFFINLETWSSGSYDPPRYFSVQVPCLRNGPRGLPEPAPQQVRDIVAKWREQQRSMESLENRLLAVAQGCSTLKSLKEQLPEFEKYMPTEETKTYGVPALANLAADFIKAGWPKDKKPPEPPKEVPKPEAVH